MKNQIKKHYGWGILITLLWGFFYLFLKSIPFPDPIIHIVMALIYGLTITLILLFLQKVIFPRLNPFSIQVQFILKSFFYASGGLVGYLMVFLFQLLLFVPENVLVSEVSYSFIHSLTRLFISPMTTETISEVVPQSAISTLSTFTVLLVMIALISIVLSYVDTRWKQMKSSKHLQESRLKIMEMQMQPHFLFNALNTIVAVVRNQPAKAEELLINLSEFLRFNFNSANTETVTLAAEIEFTENYLKLMQARFNTKLEWHIHIDVLCSKTKIPVMIIQPFVENALKYGINENDTSISISIICKRLKHRCIIEINDNGPGIDFKNHSRFPVQGHSLDIIKQRLQLQYSRSDLLKIESITGKGTQITIQIPDTT